MPLYSQMMKAILKKLFPWKVLGTTTHNHYSNRVIVL
jgi:hypothetical protein